MIQYILQKFLQQLSAVALNHLVWFHLEYEYTLCTQRYEDELLMVLFHLITLYVFDFLLYDEEFDYINTIVAMASAQRNLGWSISIALALVTIVRLNRSAIPLDSCSYGGEFS